MVLSNEWYYFDVSFVLVVCRFGLSYFYYIICCFFFFQAEDGIRDAQESRGLGDVYKRQAVTL